MIMNEGASYSFNLDLILRFSSFKYMIKQPVITI